MVQQSRSERNSTPRFPLPCTVRQLSGGTLGVYWFSSLRYLLMYFV
jgi:hypothetical protein